MRSYLTDNEQQILGICSSFFDCLASSNIRYCHWKSNFRLVKALAGETDLDLLVHRDDRGEFERICLKLNIKKIISSPLKKIDELEDYLGFDYDTGRLIHLHVHYRLVLGQKYIKNHCLPIEKFVLGNLDLQEGVHVPVSEIELMLLVIRAHMKLDALSLLKHCVRDLQRRDYSPFPPDIEKELNVLVNNYDIARFADLLAESGLPIRLKIFTGFIEKFSEKNYGCIDAFKTSKTIISSLKIYRRQKGGSAFIKYLYLKCLNSRVIRSIVAPNRKTVDGSGKVFSFVGADGSGKSTLISNLEKWLSWKLKVKKYYYGIPKTNSIKYADYAIRVANKIGFDKLRELIEGFLWVYVAKYRYKVYRSSKEDIKSGIVVLTDRFPLKEFESMAMPMDGPRLKEDRDNIGQFFSQKEAYYYNNIRLPDKILVLQVVLDELRRRKADLDISLHREKAEIVNDIIESEHITLIDANKPYDEVLLEVKRKIWNVL